MNKIDRFWLQEVKPEAVAEEDDSTMRPTIVCLCGSTKFKEAYQKAYRDEGLAGKIVLSVVAMMHSEDDPNITEGSEAKVKLDELHLRKVDLADEILVLNVGGYIGDSTRREIRYALANGTAVRYLEPSRAPTKEWLASNDPWPKPALVYVIFQGGRTRMQAPLHEGGHMRVFNTLEKAMLEAQRLYSPSEVTLDGNPVYDPGWKHYVYSPGEWHLSVDGHAEYSVREIEVW